MSDLIRAAGAVLWRPGPRGPEVLLVHRPRYDDWSLPKGKREPGEHILLTAVREVREETTVDALLGPRLRPVSYQVRGLPKRVDYWLAQTAAAAPDNEVDAVDWVPLPAVAGRLSYPHDRDLLAGLTLQATVPLIIGRHATAVPKGTVPDSSRPLDAGGAAEADQLAGLFRCFAPRARVVSSPAARCTQTVAPYAALAGVPVEADPSLSTQSGITTDVVSPAQPLLTDLALAGRAAIVCLHRENLSAVLKAACDALDAKPPDSPGLPKGGFWVLHTTRDPLPGGGRLAAIDCYEP